MRKKEVHALGIIGEVRPVPGWILVSIASPQEQFTPSSIEGGWAVVRARIERLWADGPTPLLGLRVGTVVLLDDAGRDSFIRVDEHHALVRIDRVRGIVGDKPAG